MNATPEMPVADRILVPVSGYLQADFARAESIATLGLESCVGLLIYRNRQNAPSGTCAHLTNTYINKPELMRDFLSWQRAFIEGAYGCLVGGWPGCSDELIRTLRSEFPSLRLTDHRHLNVPYYQDVLLNRQGIVQVSAFSRYRDPGGDKYHQIGFDAFPISRPPAH